MRAFVKYPRTPHLSGSRIQPGDEDVPVMARELVEAGQLVIEEKLDGSNCAISFGANMLLLQSRGHILTGGPRERQFDLLKRWAGHHQGALREMLGERYIMYGEWMYARHTVAYDQLPHYFLEFDIWDRESGLFLSTGERQKLLAGGPVVSVPILCDGPSQALESYIGPSKCSSTELMEGLYLKREEAGYVTERYKFVRAGFVQEVEDSGSHWMDRPLTANQLKPGVDLFA